MLTAQILIIAVVAIGLVASYIVLGKTRTIPNRAFKILIAVLGVVFFVRYMWDRDLLMNIVALKGSQIDSVALTVVALVANWLLNSVIVLILLHPFYSSSRSKIIVRYYGGAVLLLYLSTLTSCTMSLYGADVYSCFDIRVPLMAIELGILIAVVAIEWIKWASNRPALIDNTSSDNVPAVQSEVCADSAVRKVNTNKMVEILSILGLMAGMIVANWPSYFLEAVATDVPTDIVYKGFSIQHIILYVCALLLPVAMYFVLRYRRKDTIRHILTYIALSTIISFCNTVRFVDYIDVADWPIHICNLTMYLIPVCLIFNNKKLFSFVALVSVPSAIIAMLFPNFDISSTWVSWALVRFFTNHYTPLALPVLMVMLGVYSRPTLRDVKHGIIALFIFFGIMLLANAYCVNETPDIDFFFLYGTQITSVLGMEGMRSVLWTLEVGSFTFMIYPIYYVVFLVTMSGLCFAMWFLYNLLLMLDSKAKTKYIGRMLDKNSKTLSL